MSNANALNNSSPTFSVTQAAGLTVNSLTPIVKVKNQIIPSTATYTPSTGMVYAFVQIVGGGGGSGGCASTSSTQIAASAGGGGGEYACGIFSASDIGASQSVTIGSGGTAGAAGNNNGGNGTETSFGSLMTALGGSLGQGSAAVATNTIINPSTGGAGGTGGTGGDYRCSGGNGSGGECFNFNVVGYNQLAIPGSGGNNLLSSVNNPTTAFVSATVGNNYGGGASGCANTISSSAQAGAAGANGICIVTEFCNQ